MCLQFQAAVPKPLNPDVWITEVSEGTAYVLQFGGYLVDDITLQRKAKELKDALAAGGESFAAGKWLHHVLQSLSNNPSCAGSCSICLRPCQSIWAVHDLLQNSQQFAAPGLMQADAIGHIKVDKWIDSSMSMWLTFPDMWCRAVLCSNL